MGAFGVVSIAPSEPGFGDALSASGDRAFVTSSAAATRQASRMALVSMTHVKSLPWWPPDFKPEGPLRSCAIIFPASTSETLKTAARLARVCGEMLATNSFPWALCPFTPFVTPLLVCPFVAPFVPLCASHGVRNDG